MNRFMAVVDLQVYDRYGVLTVSGKVTGTTERDQQFVRILPRHHEGSGPAMTAVLAMMDLQLASGPAVPAAETVAPKDRPATQLPLRSPQQVAVGGLVHRGRSELHDGCNTKAHVCKATAQLRTSPDFRSGDIPAGGGGRRVHRFPCGAVEEDDVAWLRVLGAATIGRMCALKMHRKSPQKSPFDRQ